MIAMKVNGEIFLELAYLVVRTIIRTWKEGQQEFFGCTWDGQKYKMAYNTSTYP